MTEDAKKAMHAMGAFTFLRPEVDFSYCSIVVLKDNNGVKDVSGKSPDFVQY